MSPNEREAEGHRTSYDPSISSGKRDATFPRIATIALVFVVATLVLLEVLSINSFPTPPSGNPIPNPPLPGPGNGTVLAALLMPDEVA